MIQESKAREYSRKSEPGYFISLTILLSLHPLLHRLNYQKPATYAPITEVL